MKIKTRCDNCGKVYNMASEYIGRTAQCKHCGHHFIMNPYEAAAMAAQPQAAPAAPPRPQAAPAPTYSSQPRAMAPAAQHPMADQTILPNLTNQAQNYTAQPMAVAAPQTPYQQAPQMAAAPYAPQQPAFQARPGAGMAPMGGMQTVLCLKCGHSVDIPVPTKKMKLTCQACGSKIAVTPEKPKKAPKAGGGSSGKSVLLLLILVLIIVGALFVGPMLLPDIFPDIIGTLLG